MIKHANIYYLFLEDREKHPISADKNKIIRKSIEVFYSKLKTLEEGETNISVENLKNRNDFRKKDWCNNEK